MANILMTGGTSGIGLVAANRMRAEPDVRLAIGVRRPVPHITPTFQLDLARLASVREFADKVVAWLDGKEIDALVLNAGVSFPHGNARTEEGLETTFVVNHLAQHLLLRLLLPSLSTGARVIFTSSSTHDPVHATLLPPPHHANALLLAHPECDPERDTKAQAAGGRAYTSSKLCNVLTAQVLRRLPAARDKQLRVAAYDPGATPGTGLLRNGNAVLRWAWWLLGTPIGKVVPRFGSAEQAGACLAALALGSVAIPKDSYYVSLVRKQLQWCAPSELAQDVAVADRLWNNSETLAPLG